MDTGNAEPDPTGAFVVGPILIAAGQPGGPLSGRRFAAKDLFDVAGTRTGAGNPDFLADAPLAPSHAAAVEALLAAGAELVGKTVTDELAYSMSGTNVHYGTPLNPAAPGRVPGGSSSGSASAVASGIVDFALGTDTGGSIHVPASYCGLYGFRPTHGRISTDGVVPLAPSFDTVGLLAPGGFILEAAWEALVAGAGKPTTRRRPERAARLNELRRLVVVPELFGLADEAARDVLAVAIVDLAAVLGVECDTVPLADPSVADRCREAFRTLQRAEAWQEHGGWIESRRPRLGPGIAARFAAASQVTPADVAAAVPVRHEVGELLAALLRSDGLLAQPAAAGPAPPPDLEENTKDRLRTQLLTLTSPAGLAGAPVLSLPLAKVDGLPVGVAVVGLPGDDELLIDLAALVGVSV